MYNKKCICKFLFIHLPRNVQSEHFIYLYRNQQVRSVTCSFLTKFLFRQIKNVIYNSDMIIWIAYKNHIIG